MTSTPWPESEDRLVRGPASADRRLVLLHGWGADADDLLDLAELVIPPALAGTVNVVSLRAPQPHPLGMGRQWYPLLWQEMLPEPAWEQVPAARQDLRGRLKQLAGSVPLEHTALLGFSQGAAMALDAATGGEAPLPLAAVIGCSGYPHRDWQPRASATPVLLTHGREDPVVLLQHCNTLQQQLEQAGIAVTRQDFSGGHGIDPELFPLLQQFLAQAWAMA
jgi:phospholipase/carboxylesterase